MNNENLKYKNIVAFAGNPNVGKSTVFNELTGLKQHTGNWAGKTVALAEGYYTYNNKLVKVYDLPGTYSLISSSKEEEIARDFICLNKADKVVVVCDATLMERNLNLVLQVLEITDNVIVCVNLIDEAKNKKISINFSKLSKLLGVPVVPVCARKKEGIGKLKKEISEKKELKPFKVKYQEPIEKAIETVLKELLKEDIKINKRWLSIKLLSHDESVIRLIGEDLREKENIKKALKKARDFLRKDNISPESFKDIIASDIVITAEGIYLDTVSVKNENYNLKDRKKDRIFTNAFISYPIMLLGLGIIFYITLVGANYPSRLLSKGFSFIENKLYEFFLFMNIPLLLSEIVISGVLKVVFWVVAVMLPPMAIFFPLFTILEDSGILPRIAFNLDKIFKKCNACGKQSLTMCMGFGCNAVGVTGTRIIDSKRERLIAVLTNTFVPCNGRFPTIIAIISMFFIGENNNYFLSSLFLTLIIILSVVVTFITSKLLSLTVLKGEPSSYTLELPSFRKPQFFKVIVRSIFDRTLFVLGRAVAVAAPAGLFIWLFANVKIGDLSLLKYISDFLDPFGKFIGLDGVIIFSFILGFPANEIVVPIMLMAYLSKGTLVEYENITILKRIFIDNGWTFLTALNVILFSLFHFPCSTTLLTIKKETGSLKWTFVAFILPVLTGILFCAFTTFVYNIFV